MHYGLREDLLGVETRLTSASILTLLEDTKGFVTYYDASKMGLEAV